MPFAELNPQALEMLLRALPFDERLALEARWEAEATPQPQRFAEATALTEGRPDGCDWD